MEKLLKLLNERTGGDWTYQEILDNLIFSDESLKRPPMPDIMIVSKRFWFVKWLCENDKIDYEKDDYGMIIYKEWTQVYLESYEEVLMELAIQKKPIEFLISILK